MKMYDQNHGRGYSPSLKDKKKKAKEVVLNQAKKYHATTVNRNMLAICHVLDDREGTPFFIE